LRNDIHFQQDDNGECVAGAGPSPGSAGHSGDKEISMNRRTYDEFAAEYRAATSYDPLARCDGCGQMRRESTTKKVGKIRLCKNCIDNFAGRTTIGEYPRSVA
jgi:hypothetical protein